MEDRGEKIVFLARELLEQRDGDAPARKRTLSITMTFKTLCFTTLLAAGAGSVVSTCVHERNRPLNRYERTELQALIFYASKTKKMDETALRRDVENHVGVTSFDDMTAQEFTVARLYLQEKAQ